jgi:hypothetical protein
MLEAIRKFLKTPAGMGVAVVLAVLCLGVAVYSLRGAFSSEGANLSAERMFIDSSTNKPFEHELTMGEGLPVKAPSGGKTGYPAEACYWTKTGQTKNEPTWVLVSQWTGGSDPTFCPDCGRLVVGHNPKPTPGMRPPPTKEEYAKNPRAFRRTN